MEQILVTDLGGVIYSYVPDFDQLGFSQKFESVVDWYLKNQKDFSDRLDVEKEAVKKGLVGEEGNFSLPIFINQEAVIMLRENAKKYKIVVISTSRKETSEMILKKAFNDNEIILSFDIYDMSEFGSKKDSQAWKKIFEKYKDISVIIEDGPENLKAADSAARQLGFSPRISEKMFLA